MGILDFLGKNNKNTYDFNTQNGLSGEPNQNKNPISVFTPQSFNDVEAIIDTLKSGKSAIVHLNGVKTETAIRVTDFLSGAVYALNGGVYEMEKNIFMFSPTGVEMH